MANTYLSRTQGTGNRQKFTYSAWIKRGALAEGFLFQGYTSTSSFVHIKFDGNNKLQVFGKTGGSDQMDLVTSRAFRDTGAFYHVIVAIDTTQSTDTNRVKVYINGVQETSFSTTSYPSVNANLEINVSGYTNYIGAQYGSQAYYGGLMSYVAHIDGTQELPTIFGETDATTGEWKIKTSITPSVAWGTNGFLILKDGNSLTDQSANSNNFTLAGGTLTNTEDCPSNVFATWNVIMNNAEDGNWSNGNTTIAPNGDGTYLYAPTTIGVSSGKWYSEHMITGGNGYGMLGAISEDNIVDGFRQQTGLGTLSNSFGFRCRDGAIRMASSNTTYGSAPGTSSAILGMALDMDNKKVWYHVNGTYVTYGGGVGNPGAGTYGFDFSSLTGSTFLITCGDDTASGYGNFKSNFGNGYFGTTAISSEGTNASGIGKFEYDVPTGFTALSTKGLNE
jgi:hypothetical protein